MDRVFSEIQVIGEFYPGFGTPTTDAVATQYGAGATPMLDGLAFSLPRPIGLP
jgi:hypothetical protein